MIEVSTHPNNLLLIGIKRILVKEFDKGDYDGAAIEILKHFKDFIIADCGRQTLKRSQNGE